MATLLIRNLDDSVRDSLRVRAAERGRSMEEEARLILANALERSDDEPDAQPGSGAALWAKLREGLPAEGVEFEEYPDRPYKPRDNIWGDDPK
jgi:plasmid stability protein